MSPLLLFAPVYRHTVIASEREAIQECFREDSLDSLRRFAMTSQSTTLYFFTSGQRDCSSDWNASLPGTVASSL